MQTRETPPPSLGKSVNIPKILLWIVVIGAASVFTYHTAKENAGYDQAMKSLEESKRSTDAIRQALKEIQKRK
jgi:hypothetical protein